MLLGVSVLLAATGVAAAAAAAPTGGEAAQYEGPPRPKRDPLGFNARGFHDDIFGQDFGVFHTVKRSRSVGRPLVIGVAENPDKNGRDKREVVGLPAMAPTTKAMEYSKRRPEMGSSGFHGDTFSSGFGEFWTMKKKGHTKRDPEVADPIPYADSWSDDEMEKKSRTNDELVSEELPASFKEEKALSRPHLIPEQEAQRQLLKNKIDWERIIFTDFPVKSYMGGNEDAVINMLRHLSSPVQTKGDSALHDAIQGSSPVYEKSPDIDGAVLHRDMLLNGFADIWKPNVNPHQEKPQKRRPEMGSSGFHGNMFSNGFGEFWPMKKRSDWLELYGDNSVDKLQPMKRRPEMDSFGFHGDTFHNGFGDFWPMKKSISKENIANGNNEPKTANNFAPSDEGFYEICTEDEGPGRIGLH